MSEFDRFFKNLDTGRRANSARPSGRKSNWLEHAPPGWVYRGHRHARGRRLKGEPDVWRGPQRATRQDGATRVLQMLRAMAGQPGAWWARFDLRAATGMPYNSLKAIVAKAERRGLVQRRAVEEGLRPARTPWRGNPERIGRAAVRFRITQRGLALVAMCE